jgi:hypothetical protein
MQPPSQGASSGAQTGTENVGPSSQGWVVMRQNLPSLGPSGLIYRRGQWVLFSQPLGSLMGPGHL